MTDKLENPTAFPSINPDYDGNWNKERHLGGMSLRDYFAAHAPIMTEQWMRDSLAQGDHWIDANVAFAYTYADAMLKTRQANHD